VQCKLYLKINKLSTTSCLLSREEHICYVCDQAFIAIEKGFFELINDSLAEKYNLMMQIPAVCVHCGHNFDN